MPRCRALQFVVAAFLLCTTRFAASDGMHFAFRPGDPVPGMKWIPPKDESWRVDVYEPAQRAVILFNGEEEVLVLSTDLRASANTALLEIEPFPSKPEAKLGKFEEMRALSKIAMTRPGRYVPVTPQRYKGPQAAGPRAMTEKQRIAESASIEFHEQLGAHDITIVEALDIKYFGKWVAEFLRGKKGN